jgi:hypothetical protein
MSKLISDSSFIKFKWPKGMPSFRPKKDFYKYMVYIYPSKYSRQDSEKPLLKLSFDTEPQANLFMKLIERSNQKPIAITCRLPVADEQGYIE